jgi:DNA-binding transcriptional MerR regulator
MSKQDRQEIRLSIGDLARLLGVSTKTIRHYHRIGLLDEPPRAPNGYREYCVDHLITLVRARQLQTLGLTLADVKRVMRAPRQERSDSARAMLAELAGELDKQIATLQQRRAHLTALLEDPTLDLSEQPTKTTSTLRWAHETLGVDLDTLSPALLAEEARILGLVDAVRWPGDAAERLREMERTLAGRPDNYAHMLAFVEVWAALADEAPDSPKVEAFIASMRASDALKNASDLIRALPALSIGPTEALLAETLRAALTPAQRRILDALGGGLDEQSPRQGGAE